MGLNLSSIYIAEMIYVMETIDLNETPLLSYHPSMPISLSPPPLVFPDMGVATGFPLVRYDLTDEDITKAFRDGNGLVNESSQNLEDVSELLNECGLTTDIRRVVPRNPRFLLYKLERIPKPTMRFLRIFVKEKVIAKIVDSDSKTFNSSEDRLQSAISVLKRLGIERNPSSESMVKQPYLPSTPVEKVMESLKLAEDLRFRKGSKMFPDVAGAILGIERENLDRKLRCLSSLGFLGKQISDLWRRRPCILGLSVEKLKNNADVLVGSAEISFDGFFKYPTLLGYGLQRMMVSRYRVMVALKSMQVLETEMGFPRDLNLSERSSFEKYLKWNAKSFSALQDVYRGEKAGKLIINRETYNERASVNKIKENCGISSLSPSSTQGRNGVTDFLISKCGSTEKDTAKASRLCNGFHRGESGQKLEEVLELLNNGCCSPPFEQIRRVVLGNTYHFLYECKRILKSRIKFLTTFMEEEDFANFLVQNILMPVRMGLNLGVHSCKDWVLWMTCYQN